MLVSGFLMNKKIKPETELLTVGSWPKQLEKLFLRLNIHTVHDLYIRHMQGIGCIQGGRFAGLQVHYNVGPKTIERISDHLCSHSLPKLFDSRIVAFMEKLADVNGTESRRGYVECKLRSLIINSGSATR
jgi:hypothetical protein